MEELVRKLHEKIAGKKVMILGFGKEGRSSLRRVLEAGGALEIAIADRKEVSDQKEISNNCLAKFRFLTGENYQKQISEYDIVLRSPGIVLEPEILADERITLGLNPEGCSVRHVTQITSQAELFLECYGKQTIGVTGTKGKSTTTTLLYHILKENKIPVVLMGNIGIPAFDRLEEMTPERTAVFEFSCHQLEYNSRSPHQAVYLNLYEEHLDHYGSFEKYQAAKENIYQHQKAGEILYCGQQVLPTELGKQELKVIYPYGEKPEETYAETGRNTEYVWLEGDTICYKRKNRQEEERFIVPTSEIRLLGHHNLFDIAVAYAVSRDMGVSADGFCSALLTYQPLPHRLEYVGTYGGIRFYDDSISTICETTIQALETVPNIGSVLIGGMDREIDYGELITYLVKRNEEDCQKGEAYQKLPHVILMEATGRRIWEEMMEQEPRLIQSGRIHLVGTLKDAVALAWKVTNPGEACVLSPAAASYGIFRNFEERGDRFRQLVQV